ncbi:hypothetical protein KIN20_018406 [Parelaphostrongylus tenuis]|uniref:Iron-binding zinc finger CDGSH type domain-containing protein n=1 Tax=Parelaphostrongylus tenuis TaxID=148309 RepID=A0AAD5N1X2_PARTN|nr:hypothetical protein KIN20_018406 [Parelaphostrongylus tenuis]
MYKNILHWSPLPPVVSSIRGKAKGVIISNPSADMLPYKGVKWDHKPAKVSLEAGKTYVWCSCGLSSNQPFCDKTHGKDGLTNVRPVQFQVEKSGEYILCNCKQTNHRPICDGSHKTVSAAPRDHDASQFVQFGDNSPIYDGVARKLGYRPKNGGFQ